MRNIKIVLTVLIAVLTLGMNAQKKDQNILNVVDGPKITFAKKVHDFGTINEGDVVETTFEFKNTGNAPLLISRIKASCGCTLPSKWKKEEILPGEASSFVVKFNSRHKPNRQSKKITVYSNTPKGTDFVTIKAQVIPDPKFQKEREERMKKWKEKRATKNAKLLKDKNNQARKKQMNKNASLKPATKDSDVKK